MRYERALSEQRNPRPEVLRCIALVSAEARSVSPCSSRRRSSRARKTPQRHTRLEVRALAPAARAARQPLAGTVAAQLGRTAAAQPARDQATALGGGDTAGAGGTGGAPTGAGGAASAGSGGAAGASGGAGTRCTSANAVFDSSGDQTQCNSSGQGNPNGQHNFSNTWDVYDNMWNCTANCTPSNTSCQTLAPESIYVCSTSSWYVTSAQWSQGGAVMTFPGVQYNFNSGKGTAISNYTFHEEHLHGSEPPRRHLRDHL